MSVFCWSSARGQSGLDCQGRKICWCCCRSCCCRRKISPERHSETSRNIVCAESKSYAVPAVLEDCESSHFRAHLYLQSISIDICSSLEQHLPAQVCIKQKVLCAHARLTLCSYSLWVVTVTTYHVTLPPPHFLFVWAAV